MTAIFLDVDGVLNCFTTKDRAPSGVIGVDDEKISILGKILDLYEGSEVILTSTWKEDLDEQIQPLSPDAAYLLDALARQSIEVSGKTENDGQKWHGSYWRGAAIIDYIREHEEIERILILDDDGFDYKERGLTRYWVRTSKNAGGGLSERHVKKAADILSGQTGRADFFQHLQRKREQREREAAREREHIKRLLDK